MWVYGFCLIKQIITRKEQLLFIHVDSNIHLSQEKKKFLTYFLFCNNDRNFFPPIVFVFFFLPYLKYALALPANEATS